MKDNLDVSLTTAGVKMTGGGFLLWAWFETNMNTIIGLVTLLYLVFQIIVIWPKTWAELKRHFNTVKGWFHC